MIYPAVSRLYKEETIFFSDYLRTVSTTSQAAFTRWREERDGGV